MSSSVVADHRAQRVIDDELTRLDLFGGLEEPKSLLPIRHRDGLVPVDVRQRGGLDVSTTGDAVDGSSKTPVEFT